MQGEEVLLLGSHVSVAGGLHTAFERAQDYGFSSLALFVRSPRQWNAPPLDDEKIRLFKESRKKSGVSVVVAHANYLFNLAGEPPVRGKSIEGLTDELSRCAALGIEYLVLHPGSCPDTDEGVKRIIDGLDQAMAPVKGKKPKLLVEGTAGQGNTIGHKFEHLTAILKGVKSPDKYGVCLDTCHLFAAGFDIRTPAAWKKTMDEFDQLIGIEKLLAFHCNDSLKPFNSKRDRHAHIGEGEIGLEGFRCLVQDERLKNVPLILETPKENRESDGRDWDEINAERLLSLM